MAIQDIWLENLKSLVIQEGGGRAGTRKVADLADLNEEYVYQIVTGKLTAKGKLRFPGKEMARKLSVAFANGREDDWFDHPKRPPSKRDFIGSKMASIEDLLESIPDASLDDAFRDAILALAAYSKKDKS